MYCKRHKTSGCLLRQSIIHFCSHYVKIFAYLMSKLFHYNQFMWKTVVLSSIILSWTCSLPLSTVFMICNDDFLFYSGPATHHRSVRGSQRWTQPHLAAGGALWRDTGKVMLMWGSDFPSTTLFKTYFQTSIWNSAKKAKSHYLDLLP